MKIGVFDSGVGGLIILRAIREKLPHYDYVYLGDTKRVPYGNRSQKQLYAFTKQGIEYLCKQNCSLIVVACNSASSRALRKLQRQWLPKRYPERRILGVIIPTAEASLSTKARRIGVLATKATVLSKSFSKELKKLDSRISVVHRSAPDLVRLIEDGYITDCQPLVECYLKPLLDKKVQSIILGCTHYPILKKMIRSLVPSAVSIISQDEVIPQKLIDYLKRHKEIESSLSRGRSLRIDVTRSTAHIELLAQRWFRKKLCLKKVST